MMELIKALAPFAFGVLIAAVIIGAVVIVLQRRKPTVTGKRR